MTKSDCLKSILILRNAVSRFYDIIQKIDREPPNLLNYLNASLLKLFPSKGSSLNPFINIFNRNE